MDFVAPPRPLVAWDRRVRAVGLIGMAGVALVGVALANLALDPRVPTSYPAMDPVARVLDLLAGLGLIVAGIAALAQRTRAAVGPVAILLGIQWLAADLVGWQSGPVLVRSVAMLLTPLAIPLLAHLLLLQLDDVRPRPGRRRLILVLDASFALSSLLHALTWVPALDPTCWMNCAGNAFLIAPNPGLARAIDVGWMAASLLGGLVIASIALRNLLTRTRPARVLVGPVLAGLALVALALAGHGLLGLIRPPEVPEDAAFEVSYLSRAVAESILAAGLAWTALVARRRADALARMAADLADSPNPGSFQSALRRSLGDAALDVAYWLPSYGRYVDVEGRPAEPSRGRATAMITRDGQPVAIVAHDPALVGTRELEDQIGAAARVALDNERLQAEVLAQLDDLRRARTAIVDTGDAARRRLERDLHDGVQQRLLAAAYELQLAQASQPAGAAAARRLEDALETTRRALREIRSLAQGIHPLILTDAGLAAALSTFAEEASIPLELAVERDERYPVPVETTAYAVATEAVQDAVSRGATYCAIAARRNEGRLALRIEDDGATRDEPPIGVLDRIGALGGTVAVEPGVMLVELPCE